MEPASSGPRVVERFRGSVVDCGCEAGDQRVGRRVQVEEAGNGAPRRVISHSSFVRKQREELGRDEAVLQIDTSRPKSRYLAGEGTRARPLSHKGGFAYRTEEMPLRQ